MADRLNILVLCARNKKRSRTAEHIFKNDSRFSIRSAGFSSKSERQVSENDVKWADLIFVMESDQRARIRGLYRYMDVPPIEVLDIEDNYEFMDEELVQMLRDRMNHTLETRYRL